MTSYLKHGTALETSYKDILKNILEDGELRNTRNTTSFELSPFVWTTSNPLRNVLTNKQRNINKAFSIAEFLWLISGRNDVEMLKPYNGRIRQYAQNKLSLTGAYGPKITQQLPYVLNSLIENPGSRQAVITTWERNPEKDLDIPCTISLQFLINTYNELDLITTMRSNDVWLGFPYDIFNFTSIQSFVSFKLGVDIGRYTHQAASEHLYDNNINDAKLLVADSRTTTEDIVESEPIKSDMLLKTLELEQALRAAYYREDSSFLAVTIDKENGLDEPWSGWLKTLNLYLLTKLK